MDEISAASRLSRLSTPWSELFLAHDKDADEAEVRIARAEIISRYERVVRSYLRALLRQTPNREEQVEECWQELALKLISGAFQKVKDDAKRGSFRYYLKACARNLAADCQRRQHRAGHPLGELDPAAAHEAAESEYNLAWRDQLVAFTLQALNRFEQEKGQPLYTVLRLRTEQPSMRSAAMATNLSERLGKEVDENWVRKQLHKARKQFAELLIDNVARSLTQPTLDDIEEELVDLGLIDYCRAALKARRK